MRAKARHSLGRLLRRFRRDAGGATAIEYALIAVGIACAVAATVTATGTSLNANYYAKINEATKN